jgi:hypothetical protein
VHSTTTFDRIVQLYDEERRLLDRAYDDDFTADERQRLREIGSELMNTYWPLRRKEIVFQLHGTPRLISAPNPQDHKRVIAHGIAPLPNGRR